MKKTYLVTGAAGFIGSRFVESCLKKNIQVIAVDVSQHFQDRGLGADCRIIDRDELLTTLQNDASALGTEIHAIAHIGARTDTQEMNEEVLKRLNLEYSKTLWNYAAQNKIPFVYASSAATYGSGELGYNDDESLIARLKPLNPYGESKRVFDLWALEQEKKKNTPPSWAGFKFFNVYGFGEGHKGFMASVVLHSYEEIQARAEVKLFKSHREGIADGHQKRDFILVDDIVDVLHFALDHPIRRGIYNLGTGQARTFLDLARAVFKAMGKTENIRFVDMPEKLRERYQYFTQAKMDRLRAQGYEKPFTRLEDGVAKYVARLASSSRAR